MQNSRSPHALAILVLAGFGLCHASVALHAAVPSDDAKLIARRLEDHYRNTPTLRAIFLERYSQGLHDARIESGTVYFARPGRMRWEYDSPEQQIFISDGKIVWFYVPADHTVTRMPVKESTDWRTPLALLTGKADLSKLCSRIELGPQPAAAPRHALLRCLPKGQKIPKAPNRADASQNLDELPSSGDFTEVRIEVDRMTGQLADVEIRQPGGIVLEYRFGNWEENIDLPVNLFRFQAPLGVAIVDGAASSNPNP